MPRCWHLGWTITLGFLGELGFIQSRLSLLRVCSDDAFRLVCTAVDCIVALLILALIITHDFFDFRFQQVTVYNEMLRRHPELIDALYQPQPLDTRGKRISRLLVRCLILY